MATLIPVKVTIVDVPTINIAWDQPPDPMQLLAWCENEAFDMQNFDSNLDLKSNAAIDVTIAKICNRIAYNEIAAYLIFKQKNVTNDVKLRAEMLQTQDKFYLKVLEKKCNEQGIALKFHNFPSSKKSPLNVYLTCGKLNIQYTPRKELTDEEVQTLLALEENKLPNSPSNEMKTSPFSTYPTPKPRLQSQRKKNNHHKHGFEDFSSFGEFGISIDGKEDPKNKSTTAT